MESMNIGASINIERTKTKNKQVAIVFADDTDFYVNGTNFESNMQQIMNTHKKLYEAIGGMIEESKILFCYQQQKYINSKQVIENKKVKLQVHNKEIKLIIINQAT